VSTQHFDLIPSNIVIDGMKFDLDGGTIYSKSLILESNGNLTITGKISATSGWIGDENGNGFEIQSRTKDNQLEYYLGNNQISHNGVTRPDGVAAGAPGVYLGPDGIGLGNGYFYVDNVGNMLTRGEITMKAGTSNNQVLHIDTEGNLTLGGNINLAGSITWSASNSPVKVLYSVSGGNPTKSDWDKATDEDDSTTTRWHTTYQSNDYYASYSYDGGQNWDTAIKIKGEDFSGGDAGLSKSDVFNMLTDGGYKQGIFPFYTEGNEDKVTSADIYINATYIKSGVLSGIKLESTSDNIGTTTIENGTISFSPSNSDKEKFILGYATDGSAYMQLGAGTEGSITVDDGPTLNYGSAALWKHDGGLSLGYVTSGGQYQMMLFTDNSIGFYDDTVIDFEGTTVQNLKITFG
jgi:hypothetical protein